MTPDVRFEEMKRFSQCLAVLVAPAIMTGCASTKAYFVDRGRDAADIFTITAGVGAGAKVRVGPLHAGIFGNHDIVGVRGGTIDIFGLDPNRSFALDVETLLIPIPGPYRDKVFAVDMFIGPGPAGRHRTAQFEHLSPVPLCYTSGLRPQQYTQIELAGGLLATLRLGFNPGELLDFLLGWTTLDIYGDDIEEAKERRSNPTSEGIRQPADGLPKPSM